MSSFFKKISRILPSAEDDPVKRQFKINVYLVTGIVILTVLTGIITFFLTIEGQEQTLVPEVRNLPLAEGMIELQEKGLNAQIQLRFSSNPEDKGKILEQDPTPGTTVKVGRKVTLRVSKGTVIDKVDNYVSWNITDLENHLQTLFTAYEVLLRLKKPYISRYDETPKGTVLEQKPLPGTEITGFTELEVVVSLGPQGESVLVKNYLDRPYREVLFEMIREDIPFAFTVRDPGRGEKAGVIVSQTPTADSFVPDGTLVQLIMTKPANIPEGFHFGLIQKTLPSYPAAVVLRVYAISPEGVTKDLFTLRHPGGLLTIPYLEERNSTIIVSLADRELFRQVVRP